jgi:hypothetical protein
MAESGAHKYDVFISYSRADRGFSENLAKLLRKLDLSVWFDLWSIKPGERWQHTIEHALDAETALFVIGPEGIEKWQSAALQATLVKSIENPDVRIVPVLAPGSKSETIPLALRSFRALDLRKWDEGEFRKLVDTLKARPLRHEPVIPPPKVFLCHAKEDAVRVERLYFDLRDRGLDPWYDKEKLIVGDHWEDEIIEAIRQSDFFAIFLSQVSARKTGFINREIRIAIREYQRMPYGTAYLLPVRLEECEVPGIRLDEQKSLRDLQWLDLFESDDGAIDRLVQGIDEQWRKRNSTG